MRYYYKKINEHILMKLIEYIRSDFLTYENIIQSNKFIDLIQHIISNNIYIYIELNEDLIEKNTLQNILYKETNKIILFNSADIDFPPPKYPYKYDKYFDINILPSNYESLDYYDKIDLSIIDIIKKNNLHIFSYSVSINSPNIMMIPLGIYHKFQHLHLKTNEKHILCYMNMGIPCDRWFGNPRKKIINMIDSSIIVNKHGLSNDEFYEDISKSKFMICPRGCGIDTYRLWDCIALGCIPIVEKYGGHEQCSDLPILFLDTVDDFALLTEDFLNNIYDEFLLRDFNYEKCTIDYWKNKILSFSI